MALRLVTLAGAPALLAHRGDLDQAVPAGTVLFYPGLGGSAAHSSAELTALAGAGLLAVGVDSVGHGRRRLPDFDARFSPAGHRIEEEFLLLVRATVDEVPAVVDDLCARGLARPSGIGVAGWSMGGFVA